MAREPRDRAGPRARPPPLMERREMAFRQSSSKTSPDSLALHRVLVWRDIPPVVTRHGMSPFTSKSRGLRTSFGNRAMTKISLHRAYETGSPSYPIGEAILIESRPSSHSSLSEGRYRPSRHAQGKGQPCCGRLSDEDVCKPPSCWRGGSSQNFPP